LCFFKQVLVLLPCSAMGPLWLSDMIVASDKWCGSDKENFWDPSKISGLKLGFVKNQTKQLREPFNYRDKNFSSFTANYKCFTYNCFAQYKIQLT